MLSKTAISTILAASVAFAIPAFAQDAMTDDAMAEGTAPDLTAVSGALEAATSAGLVETLASGEAYTAFVPTNDALAAVQDAATEAMADEAAFSTLIQGYVVSGTVMAADAMTLVTDGGGTATVDSLAGTPLTLAMEGDALTVNGAAVTTPDLMLGNVVIHVIDGAFLPES